QTVARLMALQPTRVLEIGCGTGLLLHRIAPIVSSYTGVDLSSSSVARLQKQIAARGLAHVAVHVAPADQAVEVVTDRVDLVILNSVVQYFPSADYLSSVIERLLDVVAPGGHIVLGDIRHLDLLTAFHTSVSLAQANADVSLEVVKAGAADRVAHESELLLSPAFFHVLQERHPRISAVTVTPKRGVASNEMTMFRYDVTLEIEGPGRRSSAGAVIDGGSLDLAGLERLLAAEAGPIRVNNLVDPRPRAALRAVDLMEGDVQRSAGSVRDELAALTGGVEPS